MRFVFALALIAAFGAGCTRSSMPELKGKIVHLVAEDNIKTSDPVQMYDMVSIEPVYQVYEGPYQYDYYSDEARVIPALADGMPAVSKDGLTVTIKFKKGLKYQDDPCFKATGGKGREVTAQDFVYGWKRHYDPKNESQGFWIFEGKIKEFKALDDHTIELSLLKPYPQLIFTLTMSFMAPVPHEAIEHYGKDFVNHPVGTGPFRAVEWNPTSKITLVKNENFRDEFFPAPDRLGKQYKSLAGYSGKKLPLVDGIVVHVLKEEQPRWLGFLSGKFDSIKIPKDNFNTAIKNGKEVTPELASKGIYLSIEPAISYRYASFNMKDSLLGQNKLLRQAIASAIDGEGWLRVFMNGRGEPQTEINPKIIPDRCGKPYRWTYNLERARGLLAKAGYPGGKGLPVLKWDTRRTEMNERQIAEFMAKNLAQIGIKLEVVANTFPAYLDKSHKGNLQLSKGGFSMDYPDAENNFQMLFGPNQAPGPNEANFDHAEFNKLYLKMVAMKPSPERRAIICKMEDILQEEVPWAYGYYEDEYRLAHRWLKNFHTSELIISKWKYVDIDETAKSTPVASR